MSRHHAIPLGPETVTPSDGAYRLSSLAGTIWSMRTLAEPMRLMALRIHDAESGSLVETLDLGAGNELFQPEPARHFDGTRPDVDRRFAFARVPAGRVLLVCLSRKARAVEVFLRTSGEET
jgi:hypothetical protein